MRTTYHAYIDPGHGWLKVPRKELHELGIADQITPYSYQRGDWVYLEEDRDWAVFTKAHPLWVARKLVVHQAQGLSRIRGYQPYQPRGAA